MVVDEVPNKQAGPSHQDELLADEAEGDELETNEQVVVEEVELRLEEVEAVGVVVDCKLPLYKVKIMLDNHNHHNNKHNNNGPVM